MIVRAPLLRGRELVRSHSRLTRQAEALWQLKDGNFSQVRRELGIGYGTLRQLLEREIDEEPLGFIQDEDKFDRKIITGTTFNRISPTTYTIGKVGTQIPV